MPDDQNHKVNLWVYLNLKEKLIPNKDKTFKKLTFSKVIFNQSLIQL
jgi:hypothetical protein